MEYSKIKHGFLTVSFPKTKLMNGHAQKQTKRTKTSKPKTTELRFRINNLQNAINNYLTP